MQQASRLQPPAAAITRTHVMRAPAPQLQHRHTPMASKLFTFTFTFTPEWIPRHTMPNTDRPSASGVEHAIPAWAQC